MILRVLIIALFLIAAIVGYGFYTARNAFFEIYDVPLQYKIGAPDADLEIVEFMNYGCQNCREFYPGLMQAVTEDGSVRLIIRPVAENDDWSKTLVLYTYAAGEQGKFLEMHEAIIQNWPIKDELFLVRIAENIGMDMDQLNRDVQSLDIKERMEENRDLFVQWRLGIVPTFFMGKAAIYRPRVNSLTAEEWLVKFARARDSI